MSPQQIRQRRRSSFSLPANNAKNNIRDMNEDLSQKRPRKTSPTRKDETLDAVISNTEKYIDAKMQQLRSHMDSQFESLQVLVSKAVPAKRRLMESDDA